MAVVAPSLASSLDYTRYTHIPSVLTIISPSLSLSYHLVLSRAFDRIAMLRSRFYSISQSLYVRSEMNRPRNDKESFLHPSQRSLFSSFESTTDDCRTATSPCSLFRIFPFDEEHLGTDEARA